MNHFLTVLLFIIPFTSFGDPIDSLTRQYNHAFSEYPKAKYSFLLGYEWHSQGELDKAINYFERAHDHAIRSDSINFQGDCAYWLGYVYYQKGRYDQAAKFLLLAEAHYTKAANLEYTAKSQWLLGKVLVITQRYTEADKYYQKAAAFFHYYPGHQDYYGFQLGYANLLRQQEEYLSALPLFVSSLKHYETRQDAFNVGRIHLHIGDIQQALDEYALANQHFEETVKLGVATNNPLLKCLGYNKLGKLSLAMGNQGAAEAFFMQSLETASGFSLAQVEIYPLNNLLSEQLANQELAKAAGYADRLAVLISLVMDPVEEAKGYDLLLRYYELTGQPEKAVALLKSKTGSYVPLRVFQDSIQSALVLMTLENAALNQAKEGLHHTVAQKENKNNFLVAVLSFVLVAGLVAGVFWRINYQKRKSVKKEKDRLSSLLAKETALRETLDQKLKAIDVQRQKTEEQIKASIDRNRALD